MCMLHSDGKGAYLGAIYCSPVINGIEDASHIVGVRLECEAEHGNGFPPWRTAEHGEAFRPVARLRISFALNDLKWYIIV